MGGLGTRGLSWETFTKVWHKKGGQGGHGVGTLLEVAVVRVPWEPAGCPGRPWGRVNLKIWGQGRHIVWHGNLQAA